MEVKVVKKSENELILETKGESIAFVNLVREGLWERKNVSEAAFIREHPYLAEPKIFLKVKSGSPAKALEAATKELAKRAGEFRELFERALKPS